MKSIMQFCVSFYTKFLKYIHFCKSKNLLGYDLTITQREDGWYESVLLRTSWSHVATDAKNLRQTKVCTFDLKY